jgi:hypothetical protein
MDLKERSVAARDLRFLSCSRKIISRRSQSFLTAMKRKIIVAAAVISLTIVCAMGLLWAGLQKPQQETKVFNYPITVDNKTYAVTLETNWDAEQTPTVSLSNSSGRHALELYFLGGTPKNVTYIIIFPTDLIGGNISLIRKYYLQDPDTYILHNDGAYNSLEVTFGYDPNFSGDGYFEVVGTEGVG